MSQTSDSEGGVRVRVCVGSNSNRARTALDGIRSEVAEAAIVEVGSTGIAGLEPLVLLTADGRTAFHARCSPDEIPDLARTADDGRLGEEDADAVVDHDDGRQTLPLPEEGPLSLGRRRVLSRCGWIDPVDADAYDAFAAERTGGDGEASTDASSSRDAPRPGDADAAFDTVEGIGLLGRGRGDGSTDAPVAGEWETAREAPGDPVVVVNANESDRRNRTDRTLLESDPLSVLDGALAVADVVGVDDPSGVVVYCNEEDALVIDRVRAAIDALGDALGTAHTPEVVAGRDEYIAGEMTMALEELEGTDRLEARLRPPMPSREGLYDRPTVVHTPRTFAQVREAVLDPEAFNPEDSDPGTRLLTVAGDVDATATLELSTGGSLRTAREAVTPEGSFKMACVGGQFGGITRTLDHTPSAPALTNAELGTEGVVELLNEDTCPVALAGRRARFSEESNCGRCVPGREGTKQLVGLLRDVYDGDYDDDGLRELTRVIQESGICEFCRTAGRTVDTAMEQFETEFEAHADGRCPAGTCEEV